MWFNSSAKSLKIVRSFAEPQLAGIVMLSAILVGCNDDQARAEWWQGEQERIELVHKLELNQYRAAQHDFAGFGQLEKITKSNHEMTRNLSELKERRIALQKEVSLLERQWVDVQESMVRDQRANAVGKNFESFESASGRKFYNVSISAVDDAGVTIRHSDGSAKLRYADLKADQRAFFGLRSDTAIAAEARELLAIAAYEQEMDRQILAQKKQKADVAAQNRRDEFFARAERSVAQNTVARTARTGPLAQAATPVGPRYGGFYTYRSDRYRSSRNSPYYRTVYYNAVPSGSGSSCPPAYSQGSSVFMKFSQPSNSRCDSFATSTLPFIP